MQSACQRVWHYDDLDDAIVSFESSQCSDVVGEERDPQILVNLPVTNVPGCVGSNAKALGL
jgi:hypothetical protein